MEVREQTNCWLLRSHSCHLHQRSIRLRHGHYLYGLVIATEHVVEESWATYASGCPVHLLITRFASPPWALWELLGSRFREGIEESIMIDGQQER